MNNMGIKQILHEINPFYRTADRVCEEMGKETSELIAEIEERTKKTIKGIQENGEKFKQETNEYVRKIMEEAREQNIKTLKEFEMNLERDSIATAYLGAKLKESYFRGESVKVPTVEEARGILDEGYRIADKYLAGREFSI